MQEKMHLKCHPGTDPKAFKAKIVNIKDNYLIFDNSYCFPRGGGQPGDIGTIILGELEIEFHETLPGEYIKHPVDSVDQFKIGDNIKCIIDKENRNRNAKMHTTQHIVSALANDLFGAETIGNQIGNEFTRIDLKFQDKNKFNIEDLESSFNDILSTNAPVNVYDWDRTTILSHDKMRHTNFLDRIPSSVKKLRVVEIVDIDLCPCGGTHVENINILDDLKINKVKSKGSGKLRISY